MRTRDLALAYEQKGMYREAIAEYRKSLELAGQNPEGLAGLARVYASAGNKAEACCIRASLQEPAREGRVSVAEMATIDIALGESDRAVGVCEKHRRNISWNRCTRYRRWTRFAHHLTPSFLLA